MHTSEVFVGGQWRPPASGETYATINPATEEVSAQVAEGGAGHRPRGAGRAQAFDEGPWPRMAAAERARVLWKLADLIERDVDKMARLETLNKGKTLFESGNVELPFAAEVFRYYAGWATKLHGETIHLRDGAFTYTLREPVGVVGAIMPWNFPLLLASWKIAPALAAGCTVVLQAGVAHADDRAPPAELAREAGFPAGVFNVVPGQGSVVGDALVAPPRRRQDRLHRLDRGRPGIMRTRPRTLSASRSSSAASRPTSCSPTPTSRPPSRGAMNGIFYNKGEVCAAGSRLLVEAARPRRVRREAQSTRVQELRSAIRWTRRRGWARWSRRSSSRRVWRYVEAGKKEGATLAAGGERVARAARQGLLRLAHRLHGRHQRHDDRAAKRSSARSWP